MSGVDNGQYLENYMGGWDQSVRKNSRRKIKRHMFIVSVKDVAAVDIQKKR